MKIQMRPVADIRPYPDNPRTNDEAVAAVARSIQEFGFRQPVVVDGDGVIVVGHTRWKAAKQLGLEKIPVHVATELTPAQCRAYRLADNRLNELAQWNLDMLPAELAALQTMDIDLSLLGFTDDELSRFLDPGVKEGECGPDEIPAPPDEATTKRGDLWLLGDHRLLCGDSGSVHDVDQLLDDQVIHLCNCDPPYNVKVEPRSNNAICAGLSSFPAAESSANGKRRGLTHHQGFDLARGHSKAKKTTAKLRAKDRPLENDFVSDDQFAQLLRAWFGQIGRVLLPGRVAYVWGGYANCANYPAALKEAGLYFSQAIIWDKEHPVLTRKDFMGAHEWCFYCWREGAAHSFFGPNNVTDLWHVKKVNPQSMIHLTEKPVELAVRAIQYSSRVGEHVLDLFGGSGSTLIAAEQTGRRAYLMELDPLYADVIVARWEKFTGRRAECVSSCQSASSAAKDVPDAVAVPNEPAGPSR
ncbi:MAG: DNA modification methylase [Phycisphaerae bacterium]|nr:DNA modification methylase [Phycisphaerae bacterium]